MYRKQRVQTSLSNKCSTSNQPKSKIYIIMINLTKVHNKDKQSKPKMHISIQISYQQCWSILRYHITTVSSNQKLLMMLSRMTTEFCRLISLEIQLTFWIQINTRKRKELLWVITLKMIVSSCRRSIWGRIRTICSQMMTLGLEHIIKILFRSKSVVRNKYRLMQALLTFYLEVSRVSHSKI